MTHEPPQDPGADYLWDRQGPADADLLALERALAPLAWQPRPWASPLAEAPKAEAAAAMAPDADTPAAEAMAPAAVTPAAAAIAPAAVTPAAAVMAPAAMTPAADARAAGMRAGPATPVRRRWQHWRRMAAALAACLLLTVGVAGGLHHRLQWPQDQAWRISAIDGAARIDGAPLASDVDQLAPGQWLQTGAGTQARLRAARIGELVVGEHSRFRIVQTGSGRHRTQLQHGVMWVRVWAPPGQFGVATPRGDVIDLGCAFELRARDDGSGSVTVQSGWVQWDNGWSEVLVPQGARLDIAAGGRPGTPYDLRSSMAFRQALAEVDRTRRISAHDPRIVALAAQAQAQDALSLLVLLREHPQLLDGPVFDRLAQLMPAHAQLTREQIRREGPRAYNLWWEQLPYPRTKRWWLHWADAL